MSRHLVGVGSVCVDVCFGIFALVARTVEAHELSAVFVQHLGLADKVGVYLFVERVGVNVEVEQVGRALWLFKIGIGDEGFVGFYSEASSRACFLFLFH